MIDLAVFYLNGNMEVFVLEQKCAKDKVWFASKDNLLFLLKRKQKHVIQNPPHKCLCEDVWLVCYECIVWGEIKNEMLYSALMFAEYCYSFR